MGMKPTLLVADDEAAIGEIIRAVAEDLGFEVTCVVEGSEVVSLVESLKPDVIALDLRMPGADGVEIVRELGKNKCKSGILLMSGMDQRTLSSVQALGRENNLDIGSTLTKPMPIDAIETALLPYLSKTEKVDSKVLVKEVQIPFEFGLDVLYEPEFQIKQLDGEPVERLKVRAQWHMDDDRVVGAAALTDMANDWGVKKGLSKMILARVLENVRIWSNQDFAPEVSIQIDNSFLSDLSTPDIIAMIADSSHVPREKIVIEIEEKSVLSKQEVIGDVLSRLRIKGFNIAVAVEADGENILTMLDSLPIDQIVVDMSHVQSKTNFIGDMDVEFQYSSLTSLISNKGIASCAANVNSSELLEFVKRCKFNSARGMQIASPTLAHEILPLFKEGKLSRSRSV